MVRYLYTLKTNLTNELVAQVIDKDVEVGADSSEFLLIGFSIPGKRSLTRLLLMLEEHMGVHVGSIDEEDVEQGIAHMIEHVAFLGSKKREKLLGTGARSYAYTDLHHTVFNIHSLTRTEVCGLSI
ncbi:stromal processing peptidase, chloroplastic-like isoform X2 [Impatiens glandulifera]|uniref:stromal processing peptidase, chloroplastic-like isoform X2 n=1 Tax=Impatiens glandulifera TaxID=253017 RepID=UPI001FB17E9D|nr:stromal processing peptidase, chloroplastic-like isoform X2 [Impatiens glandulifera]